MNAFEDRAPRKEDRAVDEAPGTWTIRPYRPEDRPAVRRICCDTGLLGQPIDRIYRDRQLFADLMVEPYLRQEPRGILVAEEGGAVVGYLIGSTSPGIDRVLVAAGFRTALRMLLRAAGGRYADHPRSREYVRWLFLRAARERPRHPKGAAHLHFNLQEGYRGRTIARRMWVAFERRLHAEGRKRYYGEFYSHPGRRPEEVYARFGFRPFDRRLTTQFRPEVTEPVHLVCVEKELGAAVSWGQRRTGAERRRT